MTKKKEKGLRSINARVVYDEETCSMYIYLPGSIYPIGRRTNIAKSIELKTPVIADYTKKGKLIGLEILHVIL